MKAYESIQSVYVVVFGLLLSRKGFQWNWFLPLAGIFLVLTLLTAPEVGSRIMPGAFIAGPDDRLNLVAAPMLLIFYPLHAFVTVSLIRRLPPNVTGLESKIIRVGAYIGSAMAAGFIWTLLMAVIMLFVVAFR